MKPKIISATLADIDSVYRIYHDCHVDLTERGLNYWNDVSERDIFRRVTEKDVRLALSRGKPVATITVHDHPPHTGLVSWEHRPGSRYIHNLVVSPKKQKNGFGLSIMEYILAESSKKGFERLRLECPDINLPFYERFGFEEMMGAFPIGETYMMHFLEKRLG